jgi:HD-GYP domain-containing protein (c-di-GMP phosphodiesterase class II)
MLFNLNEFLMAVSFALDFVEMDILGVTSNHGKRTAYISLKIAEELGLSLEELHDVVALAILHDNGVSEKSLHDKFLSGNSASVKDVERIKEHCIIGEENVREYPFLVNIENVIKYHHERCDGTGFFGLKSDEIPLMSQIIHIADVIEVSFDLQNNNCNTKTEILRFINDKKNIMFSPKIVDALTNAARENEFWENLKADNIDRALRCNTPEYSMELIFDEIRKITGVFSKIIDSKSKYTQRHSRDLSTKVAIMADYYKMNHDEKMKVIISADLHDIGKLAVPNSILDSPRKLTDEEFHIIKKHSYYTRLALQEIRGFEDITEWASNHHEKLNGKGYPFGKGEKDLDFNSRLIACLDIYEALTEERPYRRALSHRQAMEILNEMKNQGHIDGNITEDIDYVFRKYNLPE